MINFVILCGGFGNRFQNVSKTIPKILIKIKPKQTMLDWLVEEYLPKDSQIILATGHLHNKISQYISNKNYLEDIKLSYEREKLGTGGAIIQASRLIDNEDFIVLNGDTIQEIKIYDFLNKSKFTGKEVINLGCTKSELSDSGKIVIDSDNLIKSFTEKKIPDYFDNENNQFNICSSIGIYRCKTSYFRNLPISYISLEDEILPDLVKSNMAKASIFEKPYHDFGTTDRYNKLMNIYKSI